MKKTLALLAFALMSVGSVSAQSLQDVVYLKNGSIIRGVVIEQVPDGNVKVQTADGSVLVYPMTEVQKIQKEQSRVQSQSHGNYTYHYNNPYSSNEDLEELYGWEKAPRFRGFIEQNNTIGVGDYGINRYGVLASFGCQVLPYLYVGAGTGFDCWTGDYDYYDTNYWSVPLFAHLRTEFHKAYRRNVSPFVDAKIGYNFVNFEGLYFAPSVGCHFYFGHSNVGLSAYVGYVLQPVDYTESYYHYNYYSGGYYTYNYTKENCGGVRIGVSLDF